MFCKIPMPFPLWEEAHMPWMISTLPVVGIVIGGIWWLLGLLFARIGMPLMLRGALLALAPFFIAGFIHLDGYMDTSDAVLSCRPTADKVRILFDSCIGAFAAIMLGILFLLQFAAMYSVGEYGRYLGLVLPIVVVSRCFATLSIFFLPSIPESDYTVILARNIGIRHKLFVVTILAASIVFSVLYAGVWGLIPIGAVILGYVCVTAYVFKEFKGIFGDLLGCAMVIGELCGLIALAMLQGR